MEEEKSENEFEVNLDSFGIGIDLGTAFCSVAC